ncbi:hypothetical protein NGB58_25355 [Escherichia coli]|nr:hypothetical protein [Escherichia coli]
MNCNTVPGKSEIYRLIVNESELITAWIKSGDMPSTVYKKLRDKHPDVIFSVNGFLYNLRHFNYALYETALKNKSKTRLLILNHYDDIAAAICSGHTLKDTHKLVCPHITYNCFIVQLRKTCPDLHSLGKTNRSEKRKRERITD